MDLRLVIIGLFIFAAIISNKELTRKEENREKLVFLTMAVLFLVLSGLGFIFPASTSINPSYSYLFLFFNGFAAITISATGMPKVISRIAWASVLLYIIFGSFY